MQTKKIWLLILGGIVLALFILGTSYAWYTLFSEKDILVASLEIQVSDDGKGVNIDSAAAISDEEGILLAPYQFNVKNIGTVAGNYRLVLQEVPVSDLEDGCTKETLLTRDQLKYQLLLNEVEIARGSLSSLKNSQLDFRSIDVDMRNFYELRVWVPKEVDTKDQLNKHYHYQIKIIPVASED